MRAADVARQRLVLLAVLGGVATVTGVGIYCYPSTLGPVRRTLVLLHDLSGDLGLAVGLAYLVVHLRRVFRMKRRIVSRGSGYVAASMLVVTSATGAYGQILDMPSGTPISTIHLITSLALVVLACFHGAWGLRTKPR